MPVQQIIEDRYIDARRLQDLLSRKFYAGTYSMTVSNCMLIAAAISYLIILIFEIVEAQQMDYQCSPSLDSRTRPVPLRAHRSSPDNKQLELDSVTI